jgi:hypothetical protein
LRNHSQTTKHLLQAYSKNTLKHPEATETAVNKTNEQISKVQDVQNKITLATIDATRQNIKTFNENAKAFADLNKSVMQSWITAFTPKFS